MAYVTYLLYTLHVFNGKGIDQQTNCQIPAR
jgi:hypothetical protein